MRDPPAIVVRGTGPGPRNPHLPRPFRALEADKDLGFEKLRKNEQFLRALPTPFAATAPEAAPLGYYGPNGFYELKGPVAPAKIFPQARNEAVARKLWDVSERLTGVVWPAKGQDRDVVTFAAKKGAEKGSIDQMSRYAVHHA